MELLTKAKKIKRAAITFSKRFDKKTQRANDELLEIISNRCGGFAGKKVLEVGTDQQGALLTRLIRKFHAAEAVGINLVTHDQVLFDSCRVLHGDIRKTGFEEGYFDILISSSVFEHIQDFDVALEEMYRILKPGGYLYSHFGPIWSGSYGHHLWMTHNKKLYNYWNFILPPFCHLIIKPDELRAFCLKKTSDREASDAIVEYVYSSPEQNQLMYEDYERLIRASKFEQIFFKGYDTELGPAYSTAGFLDAMRLLKEKYPEHRNFMYEGITLLVRKPL